MKKGKMKSAVIFVLIATLLITVLGCSANNNSSSGSNSSSDSNSNSSSSSDSAGSEQPDSKEPITLRMSWWGGESRHKTTLEVIALYESLNPHINIEGEYGGWDGYFEKMTTQLAARTAPDIMQIDFAFLDQFTKQSDLFVDLKNNEHIDLSGLDPGFIDGLTTPSGKLIGVPTGINAYTLFMNKNLADQVGIDYTKQLTWDRLLEEGKKLHAANSNMYLISSTIGTVATLDSFIFEPYLFNITGNKLINDDYTLGIDRDSLIKTFQYINSLLDNGVIQPVSETIDLKAIWENPKWLNNEVVTVPEFSAYYIPIKNSLPDNEIITIDFPSTQGVKNTGVVLRPTNMFSVNANSKHPEEAAKFINWFLTDPEAIKISGVERSMPATEFARQILLDEGKVDEAFNNAVQYAMANQGLPQNFVSTNAEVMKIKKDVLTRLTYKEWTPEQAADEMLKQMTDKVNELKEKNEAAK